MNKGVTDWQLVTFCGYLGVNKDAQAEVLGKEPAGSRTRSSPGVLCIAKRCLILSARWLSGRAKPQCGVEPP